MYISKIINNMVPGNLQKLEPEKKTTTLHVSQ